LKNNQENLVLAFLRYNILPCNSVFYLLQRKKLSYMNKLYFKTILFYILIVFSTNQGVAQTSPLVGSMISYEAVSDDLYQINVVLYRDCKGIALPNKITLAVSTDSSHTNNVFANLAKIESAEKLSLGVNPCSPANTQVSDKGVEKLTYTTQIDLTKSPFITWKDSGKCQFYFSYINYSRSIDITTGIAGAHFNYAMLDICNLAKSANPKQNTSPKLGFEPPFYGCRYNIVNQTLGFSDTANSDSFNIKQDYPLGLNRNDKLNYNTPFSLQHPMTTYCTFGLSQPCPSNPNENPPWGFTFYEECGQMIVTPEGNNEISVLAFIIKEWRKDSFGIPRLIGISRIDFNINIIDCGDNNSPIIKTYIDTIITEGDSISSILRTEDKTVTHGSPRPDQIPDTTFLIWNYGIKEASFTMIDTNLRERNGLFVWNDTKGKASKTPYKFSVQVWDQAFPKPSRASRCFSVLVQRQASAQRHYKQYLCNTLLVDAIVNNDFLGTPSYSWKVYTLKDSLLFQSNNKRDTIQLIKDGPYKIVFSINSPYDKIATYTDTFDFEQKNIGSLAIKDSVSICQNASSLQLDSLFKPNFFGGKWQYIDVNIPLGKYKIEYAITTRYCRVADTGLLVTLAAPFIDLGKDTLLYKGESILFSLGRQGNNLWENGSTTNTRVIEESMESAGNKIVWAKITNSNSCSSIDTVYVFIYKTNNPLSVKNLSPFLMTIKPNPAHSYIEIVNDCTNCTGNIYNSIGEKVMDFVLDNNTYSIDIGQFPKGLYFLNISNNQELMHTAFIKE